MKSANKLRTAAPRRVVPKVTRTLLYRVDLIAEDDGSWTVDVPDLPGCVTWGRTREEALMHAHEAILAYLDALEKLGDPVPSGAPQHEAVTVAITI